MSVTESSAWKWLPGMRDSTGATYIGPDSTGGHWWVTSAPEGAERFHAWDNATAHFNPDLDSAATCGAIIFGIFAPLGIQIFCQKPGLWTVHLDDRSPLWGVLNGVDWTSFESIADAIRAVFAALNAEAGR